MQCECGNTTSVRLTDLRGGKTKSCGCGIYKYVGTTLKQYKNDPSYKRTYGIWFDMIRRCDDPGRPHYHSYGGRGITVCERWKDFTNFVEDIGMIHPPLSLERIDVDGNYEPSNVTLIPMTNQYKNKTNNVYVDYMGERMCLADCVVKYSDVCYWTVHRRITRCGWTIEDALTIKPGSPEAQKYRKYAPITDKKYMLNGKPVTLGRYVNTVKSDVPYHIIVDRLYNGMSLEEAIKI